MSHTAAALPFSFEFASGFDKNNNRLGANLANEPQPSGQGELSYQPQPTRTHEDDHGGFASGNDQRHATGQASNCASHLGSRISASGRAATGSANLASRLQPSGRGELSYQPQPTRTYEDDHGGFASGIDQRHATGQASNCASHLGSRSSASGHAATGSANLASRLQPPGQGELSYQPQPGRGGSASGNGQRHATNRASCSLSSGGAGSFGLKGNGTVLKRNKDKNKNKGENKNKGKDKKKNKGKGKDFKKGKKSKDTSKTTGKQGYAASMAFWRAFSNCGSQPPPSEFSSADSKVKDAVPGGRAPSSGSVAGSSCKVQSAAPGARSSSSAVAAVSGVSIALWIASRRSLEFQGAPSCGLCMRVS